MGSMAFASDLDRVPARARSAKSQQALKAATTPMHEASEIAMKLSSEKQRKFSEKFGQLSKESLGRVATYLRQRYPFKTADRVAADTGFAATRIVKWLEERSAPSFAAMLILVAAYGPDFLAYVMDEPLDWLDRARAEEERAALSREIAALEARQRTLEARLS
jgi:hypothetical protein